MTFLKFRTNGGKGEMQKIWQVESYHECNVMLNCETDPIKLNKLYMGIIQKVAKQQQQ